MGTDRERWAGLLHGLGTQPCIVDMIVTSLVRRDVLAEEPVNNLDYFLEAPDPVSHRSCGNPRHGVAGRRVATA